MTQPNRVGMQDCQRDHTVISLIQQSHQRSTVKCFVLAAVQTSNLALHVCRCLSVCQPCMQATLIFTTSVYPYSFAVSLSSVSPLVRG